MCVIIDASCFGEVFGFPCHSKYRPVIDWISLPRGDGRVVYGGGKFAREIERSAAAKRWFAEMFRAGRAIRIPESIVDEEEARIRETELCESDDEHIVALARLSGSRVVCTEDRALWDDLRNSNLVRPRARLYRSAEHARLLRHNNICRSARRRRRR